MAKLISTDTETSGFGPKAHRIIELALLPFDPLTGNITQEPFYSLFNPEKEVSKEAEEVHGLNWGILKKEPLFKDKAEEIASFLEGNILVAHNAKFDVSFLNREFEKLKMPPVSSLCLKVIDTYHLANLYLEPRVIKTLEGLCSHFKIDTSAKKLHSALSDTELLAQMYPFLMKEVNRKRQVIQSVTGVDLESNISSNVDELAEEYFKLQNLIKILEHRTNSLTDKVKEITSGLDVENDFFKVEYSATSKTNWDAVVADFLKDQDLSKYKTTGSRMTLKQKN